MTPQSSFAFPYKPLVISTHLPGKDRAQGGRRKRDLGLSHGDVEKEMEVETRVLEAVSHLFLPLDGKDLGVHSATHLWSSENSSSVILTSSNTHLPHLTTSHIPSLGSCQTTKSHQRHVAPVSTPQMELLVKGDELLNK